MRSFLPLPARATSLSPQSSLTAIQRELMPRLIQVNRGILRRMKATLSILFFLLVCIPAIAQSEVTCAVRWELDEMVCKGCSATAHLQSTGDLYILTHTPANTELIVVNSDGTRTY